MVDKDAEDSTKTMICKKKLAGECDGNSWAHCRPHKYNKDYCKIICDRMDGAICIPIPPPDLPKMMICPKAKDGTCPYSSNECASYVPHEHEADCEDEWCRVSYYAGKCIQVIVHPGWIRVTRSVTEQWNRNSWEFRVGEIYQVLESTAHRWHVDPPYGRTAAFPLHIFKKDCEPCDPPPDRSHEECGDCLKRHANPPVCKDHVAGPSPCKDFVDRNILIRCETCLGIHWVACYLCDDFDLWEPKKQQPGADPHNCAICANDFEPIKPPPVKYPVTITLELESEYVAKILSGGYVIDLSVVKQIESQLQALGILPVDGDEDPNFDVI